MEEISKVSRGLRIHRFDLPRGPKTSRGDSVLLTEGSEKPKDGSPVLAGEEEKRLLGIRRRRGRPSRKRNRHEGKDCSGKR